MLAMPDRDKVRRAIRYAQGILGLRKDDVILTSFPKSGNTWVRFFFCHVISLAEWGDRVVDFPTLDRTMPELGVNNLLLPWQHTTIPRIVKTHKGCWPIFRNRKSVLVIRDPRDTMVSFFHFENGKKTPRFKGTFSEFIRSEAFGLERWFRHYRSWVDHCTVLLRYEDLKVDDIAHFRRMLDALSIRMSDDLLAAAAERSRFGRVKKIERQFGQTKTDRFKADYMFARSGETGGWHDYFSNEDLEYYTELSRKYRLAHY
ncbi:sulfotransferase [Syntrophobacter fumaroxidans MPOB]|uniref:Sulfotransferase n=2 Tax=Syntrophobacter TaxID=29526 RepID=A0LGC5_SYNFM|nr:sulfotransferase [Syntrophobacter fumaroxidans MPOB]